MPIHLAAREGKLDIIRFHIEHEDFEIDQIMMDGWTPFFYAAVNGYLLSAEMLAKDGNCDINILDKF